MKTLTTLLCIVGLGLHAFAQRDTSNYVGKVEIIADIPVYMMSAPLESYTEVGNAVSAGHLIMSGANSGMSLVDKVTDMVGKAKEREKSGKIPGFDAIVVNLFKDKVKAVRFAEQASMQAKILKLNSVPVFLFSAPVMPYDTVAVLPNDFSFRAQRGLLIDKLDDMVDTALHKVKKGEMEQFDAIIVNPADLTGLAIRFVE